MLHTEAKCPILTPSRALPDETAELVQDLVVGILTTFVWLRHMDTAAWNPYRHAPGINLCVTIPKGG